MGDIDHLFGDDPGAGEFELGDELARPACAERPLGGTERRKTIHGNVAIVLGLDRARLRFGKVARFNPALAHWLQPAGQIDHRVALGIRPGRIVDAHRRLVRVGERDLAKRNADVGASLERRVHLARAYNRPSGHGPRRGEFRNLVHGRLLAHQIRRRKRADQWRSAAATSLRRHDPDQVQRVRLVAVSAPFGTPLEQSKCGPSGSVCQLSLKARLLCGLVARRRPARPEVLAPPYPPEGIAGRPFARLRAAKRAAR